MVSKQAQEASVYLECSWNDEYCYPSCLCKLTTGARTYVLKELHEGAVGGHLGEGKMLG